MAMLVDLSGFVLAGDRRRLIAGAIAAGFILPAPTTGETFGAWQFGRINEICAVASQSVEEGDARSFNIMVPSDEQILLYIILDNNIPTGARHFGIRVNDQVHWLVGAVDNGALYFDLSAHPESSRLLAEIIDGQNLALLGGLGEEVAQFSLRGSGQAVARLASCVGNDQ